VPTALTNEPRFAPPLDTTVKLVTPERVEFSYTLAGPFRRSLSYLLDIVVMAVLVIAGILLSMTLSFGQPAGMGPALVIYFALSWGYSAFCEAVFNGRTVGKMAMGIRVMTIEGVPITGSHAMIRNLVGTLDGPFPFLFMTSLTSMVLTSRFQRLGDLAAGTMVVVEETRFGSKVPRVEETYVAKVLMHLPLRISAGSEMSRALSDYVRQRIRFGPDRREEIARNLADPLRDRYELPREASSDAILCAFYHRLFLGE
jgi:uncharacterized RDD family membrane protein YckC